MKLFILIFALIVANAYAEEAEKVCKDGNQIITLSYDEEGIFRSINTGFLEMNIDSRIRNELNVIKRKEVSCKKLVTLINLTERREKIKYQIKFIEAEIHQHKRDQEKCINTNRENLIEGFGELIYLNQLELEKENKRLEDLHDKIEHLSIQK
jgi:hypothetical protein